MSPTHFTSFDQLYPGEFLKAGEFGGKAVTLTITEIERPLLSDGSGNEEPATVVHFAETPKKFVMNKTNGVCLRAMFGDDPRAYDGKRITLHPVKDDSGLSESGLCIRVKGSPDIDEPIKFRAHVGRKMLTQTLVPTANGAKQAAPATERALRDVSMPNATTEPQTGFDAANGEIAEEPPGRGPLPDMSSAAADEQQLDKIAKLRKSSGIYEAEFASVIDTYGDFNAEGYGLTHETAMYVIGALEERGS
jgi:hypothetical protein